MAATRQQLKNFDYAVFPNSVISALGFKCEEQRGDTPDDLANESWHLDLVELTTATVEPLAVAVNTHGELRRFRKPELKTLLKEGLKNRQLDRSEIDAKLLDKLH